MRAPILVLVLALLALGASRGGCNGDAPYDACAGKACGQACSVCPPGATDCVETAELKACDPQGRCVSDGGDLCGAAASCAGKGCGAGCTVGGAPGHCSREGVCLAGTPPPPGSCLPHPDCAGKACGASCNPCGPERTCPTFAATACSRAGDCVTAVPWLCYDPCAGKPCGASCSTCPPLPEGEGCAETAVVKACDASGVCDAAPATCGP